MNPYGIPLIREERQLEFLADEEFKQDSDSSRKFKDSESVNELNETNNLFSNSENLSKPLAIQIDKAYDLYKKGVKFIDARMPEEYKEGHISGAINIPFDGDESYRDILNNFNKDEMLVTYCDGSDCELSILLGDELFEKGFKNVYIFFGGWNDWLAKGYPISKGEK